MSARTARALTAIWLFATTVGALAGCADDVEAPTGGDRAETAIPSAPNRLSRPPPPPPPGGVPVMCGPMRSSFEPCAQFPEDLEREPDTQPAIVGGTERLQASIRYPASARQARREGVVVVRVVVDDDGTAAFVTVRRPVDPALDAEAVRVVRFARYVPATLDGRAVTAELMLGVQFTL